jgi:catechol 2,3-dioxygenase-like lactoylglutathione lyase family enzyme
MQIDHVELFVPDRYQAAEWYGRVLGLRIVAEFEHWAANPSGPLMIATAAGGTKLALFEGTPQESKPTAGFHRVAFGVDGAQFIAFVRRLEEEALKDDRGRRVSADSVVDHRQAYSIYFCDPYGHRLELTTYDCEPTRTALARARRST